MAIRRAQPGDVETLVPLKAALHELHVQHRPDFFRSMTDEAVGEWLGARVAEADCWVLLDEDGGEPRGYVVANVRSRGPSTWGLERTWCEIDEVAVGPAHRRRGVARGLIEAAIAEARRRGLERIELTAWAFNGPARDAFAALGFAPMIGRYERRAGGEDEPNAPR